MVKKQTTLQVFRRPLFALAMLLAFTTACAPGQSAQSPEQIQAQIATGVAMTVQAQNQMGTSVAMTVQAQAPVVTETLAPTSIPLDLPTLTPVVIPTVTPFVVSGGSTNRTPPEYACSWTELKPRNNVFSPGDPIDVKWVITNTGSKSFGYKRDLEYVSGEKMSSYVGGQLPDLDPGDTVTITFDANAPNKNGLYGMQFKVEGGLCWPALNIQVGKKKP